MPVDMFQFSLNELWEFQLQLKSYGLCYRFSGDIYMNLHVILIKNIYYLTFHKAKLSHLKQLICHWTAKIGIYQL